MLAYIITFIFLALLYGCHFYILDWVRFRLPPGPLPMPFIGNFYTLNPNYKVWKKYRDMSKIYGNIFTFYIGQYRMMVLHSPEVIHEAIVANSKVLNSRPTFLPGFAELKTGLLLASGAKWQMNRRFALRAMKDFGMGKMAIIERVHEEIGHFLAELAENTDKPFVPHQLIANAVSNIICSIVFGKRFAYDDAHFRAIIAYFNRILGRKQGLFFILPPLRHFLTNPQVKDYNDLTKMTRELIWQSVEEHRRDFDNNNIRDFPDLFIQTELTGEGIDKEDFLMVMLDMFGAGTETTSTTLNWALLYLCKYPEVMRRCHEEIDNVIGTARLPTPADRANLTYIDAVIFEVLRHATIGPLAFVHANLDTDVLDFGVFQIPKDTLVIYNAWSVHYDESYWKNPEVFDPNRWLDSDGKLLTHSSHFFAFGTGPRLCIGESMARMEAFQFVVSMLQRFSFKLADTHVSLEDGTNAMNHAPPEYRVIASKRY